MTAPLALLKQRDMTAETTMTQAIQSHTELPDAVRLPLHKLQADLGYLFGRVAADSSIAGMMTDIVAIRLKDIEASVLDWHEALIDCLEYFENRSDADCDQDGFIPNEEMVMASRLKQALGEA